jgi:hypothetical protein
MGSKGEPGEIGYPGSPGSAGPAGMLGEKGVPGPVGPRVSIFIDDIFSADVCFSIGSYWNARSSWFPWTSRVRLF